MRIKLLGVAIDDVDMKGAVSMIEAEVAKRANGYAVTPNVDHLVKLQKDAEFKKIYDGAACVFADGMPLLWAGKFLGTRSKKMIGIPNSFNSEK